VTKNPTAVGGAPDRAWQRMLSGRRLDLLDPAPVDVEIADIAHGLARVARWNGQTTGNHIFSVAQHSLLVETLVVRLVKSVPAKWRLAALLHDAPEYVIGDMISPFKAVIGGNYKPVEARLQAAIHIRFGLPVELPASVAASIKRADRIAAYFEAVTLAGFSPSEARRLFGRPGRMAGETIDDHLRPVTSRTAQNAYLKKFSALDKWPED
jgi:5'-deoxynucleotidase YfbR-like HD superfamily hydrolase